MNALAIQVSNDAALNRIRELEADNAALRDALSKHVACIRSLQDRLEAAAPSDYELDLVEIYGGQWESQYVMAPESVVVAAQEQLRNRYAPEFAEILESEYRLQMAEASKP